MKHKILSVILFCTFIAISPAIYAKMPCANLQEKQAFDKRAMQSYLMVAALSCSDRKSYNKFVKEHHNELIEGNIYIKNYFKRNYGSDSDKRMNSFITMLANISSRKSLEVNQKKFCGEANDVFKESRSKKILAMDNSKFFELHQIRQCN